MSEDKLKEATKTWVAARGWVQRVANKLDEVCSREVGKIDLFELEVVIQDFDNKLANFNKAQASVENELRVEELEADIDQIAPWLERVKLSRVRAAKVVATTHSVVSTQVGNYDGRDRRN